MIKRFLIYICIYISAFTTITLANPTGSDLKKPSSNAFDFTYQSATNTQQETLSDMILIEISKENIIVRRTENLFNCKTDPYGTTYCPSGLELARPYTTYSPSSSFERTATTIDYEQGTYAEKTSVVRDFMDGFATAKTSSVVDYQTGTSGAANVGTVIDYQNGSSTKRTGSVLDYASKIGGIAYANKIATTQTTSPIYGKVYYWKQIGSPHPRPTCTAQQGAILNGATLVTNMPSNSVPEFSCFYGHYDSSLNLYISAGVSSVGTTSCPAEYTLSGGQCSTTTYACPAGYTDNGTNCKQDTIACPSGYADNGTNCQKTVAYDFYQYSCPTGYTPGNYGFTSYTKTDPSATAENWDSLDDAVNSATPPPNNCQKTVTYSYYKYNCPTGYTVRDGGLTSACPKTDPDKTINNEATLSQPCNSSTPPAGNCEKIIPYTFYSYDCSAGYTAINKGLATCTKTDTINTTDTSSTLSTDCNSATPPKENCYKDISYKHYTYGCATGYVTDNYGLATCTKTDPDKSANNSGLLDDACNSVTPPEGNCKRSYSYKYYEYLCEGKNSFDQSYTTLNKGLSVCDKLDTNINTVNTELANACNSSTPPINNCKSTEFTCDSTVFNPVFVDGEWKCSPFYCDGNMRCGNGTCDAPSAPSLSKYQDIAYNPLKTNNSNQCNGDICDFVVNAKVSYCESSQCPKRDDVIIKDGKCYKLECPKGTYLSGEKCIKANY